MPSIRREYNGPAEPCGAGARGRGVQSSPVSGSKTVQMPRLHRDPQRVEPTTGSGRGANARHQQPRAEAQVDEDFVADRLDHFDHRPANDSASAVRRAAGPRGGCPIVDLRRRASASARPASPERNALAVAQRRGPGRRPATRRPRSTFIAGLPRKVATNRLAGRSYSAIGVSICWIIAILQHHDALAERHRLDLVVGDVDHGGAELAMQARDLHAHRHAQLGVEVGQRLVEQEHLRLAHQRAAERDALALAARQRGRLAIEQRFQFQRRRGLAHARGDVGAANGRAASGRSRGSRRRSCADTARSSGTPSRCRGPSARRR